MFTEEVPIWDFSSLRDDGWTRLAWCNQQKVAVYLAAIDLQKMYLGVLVLNPEACVWAHSVQFSELLSCFAAIVCSGSEDVEHFAQYATYAMANFIAAAHESHGETAAWLLDCLEVADPAEDHAPDTMDVYQGIRRHFKEPLLEDLYIRYDRMCSTFNYSYVETLERLTHQSLVSKDGRFLADVPALDNIIRDYGKTFIKNAEKASEKSEKKPKRTTNVRELLWNSYPHICGLCGEQINSIDEMHVDHIIPLSRGGKDILANLQLTHARCNMDKGNTLFEESEE
jgi:hypothetical protein